MNRYVSTYSALSLHVRQDGLLRRRYAYYWSHILITTAAFVAVWVAVVLIGNSWWQLLVAAVFAVVCAQVGFLGHDAAHRQIFASHRSNEWAARILSGGMAGLSYGWWVSKHNRHHAAPNQEGRDPDIAPGPLAFTAAAISARDGLSLRLSRYQGWAFFPLLTLEGLHLQIQSVQAVLRRERPVRHRWIEGTLVIGRHAGYVAALLLLLPPGKAVAFVAVQSAIFGLLLGCAFAPNHKGMPIVPESMKVDFLRRQVLMSRNVRGNVLIDFLMGGLNYQIEHHLFPNMPRPNLRRARLLVRAHCAENGVTYNETGLFESYGIVVRYLNAVGLGYSDPFVCPLASRYGRR